jgi:hypothetical protein
LTPEVLKSILKTLDSCGTVADACEIAGISRPTFFVWKQKGERQAKGKYRDFLDALTLAVVKRRAAREKKVLGAGEKDWRATAWMMERTEPTRYAPRVVFHTEQELRHALQALQAEFASEPELLERALAAIGRRDGGEDAPGDDGAAAADPEPVPQAGP